MATIATASQPISDYTATEGVSLIVSTRFPVPGSAMGYCVEPALSLTGGSSSGGSSTEPTTGQIWPR